MSSTDSSDTNADLVIAEIKRRMKYRLMGIVVLGLLLLIFLPQLMDSEPPPAPVPVVVVAQSSAPSLSPSPSPSPSLNSSGTAIPAADSSGASVSSVPVKPSLPEASSKAIYSKDLPRAENVNSPSPAPPSSGSNASSVVSVPSPPAVVNSGHPSGHPNAPTGSVVAHSNVKSGSYVVQVGAFAGENKAKGMVDKLKAAGLPVYTEPVPKGSGDGIDGGVRIRVGPYPNLEAARVGERKVHQLEISEARILSQ